jgi:hypothetical protein
VCRGRKKKLAVQVLRVVQNSPELAQPLQQAKFATNSSTQRKMASKAASTFAKRPAVINMFQTFLPEGLWTQPWVQKTREWYASTMGYRQLGKMTTKSSTI